VNLYEANCLKPIFVATGGMIAVVSLVLIAVSFSTVITVDYFGWGPDTGGPNLLFFGVVALSIGMVVVLSGLVARRPSKVFIK
jgi:hypothetical protein